MSKTVVVMTCAHVDPRHSNERFEWLGKFLYDTRPDEVINLGDFAEMNSLSSFDSKYPKPASQRNYEADIKHTHDAHDKMWHQFRKNHRSMPYKAYLQGNHEFRIDLALQKDPNLSGKQYGLSLEHLGYKEHYDDWVPYQNKGPGLFKRDGVVYAHFLSSGAWGRAIDGVNHSLRLVEKLGCSVTVGHSHKFNYSVNREALPYAKHGLVAGCYIGGQHDWAGQANAEWSHGVVVKNSLTNGTYDVQWVSFDSLKKAYSNG